MTALPRAHAYAEGLTADSGQVRTYVQRQRTGADSLGL